VRAQLLASSLSVVGGATGCQLLAGIEPFELTPAAAVGSAAGGAGGASAASGSAGGADPCAIPRGGALLLTEPFEDADLGARGWYDSPGGVLDGDAAVGSTSFRCNFVPGNTICAEGRPARHLLRETDRAYVSLHLKLDEGWKGVVSPLVLLTSADDDYIGPGSSALSTFLELAPPEALAALADVRNVDTACILQNDGTFIGCGGDFATYPFTEERSVAACNGLVGDLDRHSCTDGDGDGKWWSWRAWSIEDAALVGAWHHFELYLELNRIEDGKGVADGKIRLALDGATRLCLDHVLFRTGEHPSMQFRQIAMLSYMDDPPARPQTMRYDELVVATAKP
jgi:hypothetical protein